MKTRYFALIIGIAFLLAGIAGFVPGLLRPATVGPPLAMEAGYGLLLGLFPVNVLHNIVHLAIGAWGVASWRSFHGARMFARSLAIIYAILAVMGLITGLNTVFGLVPLFGHDIWLHAVTAVVAAYFGWAHVREPITTPGSDATVHR